MTSKVDDFAVVNRAALMALLEGILSRDGDSDRSRDAAQKMHFGLVHGLGTVGDLVVQAVEEEREACVHIAEQIQIVTI